MGVEKKVQGKSNKEEVPSVKEQGERYKEKVPRKKRYKVKGKGTRLCHPDDARDLIPKE
ncbi:hypothetical protein [Labilibaculum antarcticum]|uniref:Uncharacterized protein n=1 Tax=Labilibaculum antarcticum TaxID=1717717 RepID=A0A1Y1CNX8_9BACT|nr:hypothetical protein [Labilibaculum antarcticum]BAX81990.1 hypothetical protein ALGA_3698 [Labilibaculum antarcticum]